MPVKLVCFDIDDTMINGHLHRSLEQTGIAPGSADPETVRRHVEAIGGIKNRLALQKTLKDLLNNNVHVAVTSYTGYAETIPVILKMVGLTDAEIGKVQVSSFTPPKINGKPAFAHYGKNHHIEHAIAAVGGLIMPEEVVLVDDRIDHFQLAREKGYHVVWVQGGEGRVDYLDEVRTLAGLSPSRQAQTQAFQPDASQPNWAGRMVDYMLGWIGLQRIPSMTR